MKILLVDDDEWLLRNMRRILAAEHHEVCTARNGLFGYFAYLVCRPELVVTDIEMPFQDGFEMMRQIRNIEPGMRAIYMSGEVEHYGGQLDAECRNHAAAVLEKPFSHRDLSAVIARNSQVWLVPASRWVGTARRGLGPSA
jgi:DNA-binding NtrC family response regulator